MILELSSPIAADERDSLVTLLLACDGAKEFWDRIISELPDKIRFSFNEDPAQRRRVKNLVAKCLNFPDGMELLLNRMRANTDRSIQWRELARYAFQIITRFPRESSALGDRLVDLVEHIAPSGETVGKMYRKLNKSMGSTPVNGYQAILRLFQLPDKAQAIRFVHLLIDETQDRNRQEELKKWVEDAAALFAISSEQLQPDTSSAPASRMHLLIQLQSVSGAGEPFKLYSWLHDGKGVELFSDGHGRVYRLIEVADEIHNQATAIINTVGNELEIELIVNRSVFGHDVTKWEVTIGDLKRELIREIPLVLRCLERVEARRTDLARKKQGLSAAQLALAAMREKQEGKSLVNLTGWRAKFSALREKEEHEFESLIDKVVEPGHDLNQLMDELRPNDKGLCVGLGFVPAAETGAHDELSAVISSGVPIVIWFREIPPQAKVDAQGFKKLFCRPKIKLSELRRHLWHIRKEAVIRGNRDDICHHITLLYDDYDRIPPPPPNLAPGAHP